MASYNNTGAGVTGYNDPEGTHGPHSSKLANAVDPTVDSDRDHRGAPVSTGLGSNTGTTHTTHHTQLPASHSTAGTGTTAQTGTGNTGERVAKGIKGVFAQGHVCAHFPLLRVDSGTNRTSGSRRVTPRKHQLSHRQSDRRHGKTRTRRGGGSGWVQGGPEQGVREERNHR